MLCKKCGEKKFKGYENCTVCGGIAAGGRNAGWYHSDCRMVCFSCKKPIDEKKDYIEEIGSVGVAHVLCGKHEAELKGKCIVCKKPEPP